MNAPAVHLIPAPPVSGLAHPEAAEDDRLLGKGLYSDDRNLPNQAWMVVARSPTRMHALLR